MYYFFEDNKPAQEQRLDDVQRALRALAGETIALAVALALLAAQAQAAAPVAAAGQAHRGVPSPAASQGEAVLPRHDVPRPCLWTDRGPLDRRRGRNVCSEPQCG